MEDSTVAKLSLAEDRQAATETLAADFLELVEISADGNCQFHALADQIRRVTGKNVNHEDMRAAIVKELRFHRERYEIDVIVHDYQVVNPEYKIEQFEDYLECMANPGFWGDELTLQAASKMLDITVESYSSRGVAHKRAYHPSKGQKPTRLKLKIVHVGNHYDSTRPMLQPSAANPPEPPHAGAIAAPAYALELQEGEDDIGLQECLKRLNEAVVETILRLRFCSPSMASGKLYCSVPLFLFDDRADADAKVVVVTQSGRSAGIWTLRHGGDGIFRLFPVLERSAPGQDYLSQVLPPARSRYAKGADLQRALPSVGGKPHAINLELFKHSIRGIGGCVFSIPLLKGIRAPSKKQIPHPEVLAVIEMVAKGDTLKNDIKDHHSVLEFNYQGEEGALNAKSSLGDFDSTIGAEAKSKQDATREEVISILAFRKDADAAAADLYRRRMKDDEVSIHTDSYSALSWNFKRAVHEGGRRLMLLSFMASFSDTAKASIIKHLEGADVFKEAKEMLRSSLEAMNDAETAATLLQKQLCHLVCSSPWDYITILKPFLESVDGSGGDMEKSLRFMCTSGDTECRRILESIHPDALAVGIDIKHLKGEALEIFTALAYRERSFVTVRNYIEEQFLKERSMREAAAAAAAAASVVGSSAAPTPGMRVDDSSSSAPAPPKRVAAMHVGCKVEHCFISGAPRGSFFRMSEEHRQSLEAAIKEHAAIVGGSEKEAIELAKHLTGHMKRDHAFDVLVWLREEGNSKKSHFLLVQCKARADFEACVDASKYVADAHEAKIMGEDIGVLSPLVWCSNVITHHSFAPAGGKFKMTLSKGHLIPWLLPDICRDDGKDDLLRRTFLAALGLQLDNNGHNSPFSTNTLSPSLRPHQVRAVSDLRQARQRDLRCGVANKATGSGKTFTACEDALRAEAEKDAINARPSLCMAPRIDLVLQVAGEWFSWEQRRKKRGGCAAPVGVSEDEAAAWLAAGVVEPRRYFYVVCSANEEVGSDFLRIISVHDLVDVLERHAKMKDLHLCRFFTTAEGGGSFWYETRRYNLKNGFTHDHAVFGVFARDEVHKMCGSNTNTYSLGLNVPALWMPSYTATPIAEESRAGFIRSSINSGRKLISITHQSTEYMSDGGFSRGSEPMEVDGDNEPNFVDEEFIEDATSSDDDDGDNDESLYSEAASECDFEEDEDDQEEAVVQRPSQRQRRMLIDGAELFPEVYSEKLADSFAKDPALAKAVDKYGLHGLQLLTPSLFFEDLEQLSLTDPGSEKVLDAITRVGDYSSTAGFHAQLEEDLAAPVAIFAVVPSASGQTNFYDVDFDFKVRNVRMLHSPSDCFNPISDPSKCLVLGIVSDVDPSKPMKRVQRQPIKFCRRVTNEAPRGPVFHDCTSFSPSTNLIGPIVASFSFAECFAAGALAKPAIALSDRGLLRLPRDLAVPNEVLQFWSGITESVNTKEGTGLAIEDPRKVIFTVNITRDGAIDSVTATAHDFHCMSHLLDCFNPSFESGLNAVMKPIVFCPNNKVARRCLVVFCALLSQRLREAEQRNDATTADIYRSIISDHVFQSDVSTPGLGQTYEERQLRIWKFRGAERAVLFNSDLLSTGVDLPCCDCTYLHSPSLNTNVILQRWGRSLRRTVDPNKVGLLALPCTDPYEPDEDVEESWRRLGLHTEPDSDKRQQLYERFDLTCRLAECAVDARNLVLGRLINYVIRGGKAGSLGSTEKECSDLEDDASDDGKKKKGRLESLLKLMIAKRGKPPASILLSDADARLLQQFSKAIGRSLVDPWYEKVQDLKAWFQDPANKGKFPKAQIKREGQRVAACDMTVAEKREASLGGFLVNHRQAYKHFKNGVTDTNKLSGMCQERVDILDREIPGWSEENDAWLQNVQDLKAWYQDPEKNGERPRAEIYRSGQPVAACDLTAEEQHEVSVGRFLSQQRQDYKHWKKGEKDCKKLRGMCQQRVDILDREIPGWSEENDTWIENVKKLKAWFQDPEKKGARPRREIKRGKVLVTRELTEDEHREVSLGKFLSKQRTGYNNFLKGAKDPPEPNKLNGMCQERVDILDREIPGWSEENDPWIQNVLGLKAWFQDPANKGERPRGDIKREGERVAACDLTPEEQRETSLGAFLILQRQAYRHFLKGAEDPRKLSGMCQQRVDILDREVPGWSEDNWLQNVQDLKAWFRDPSNKGKIPRSGIYRGRTLSRDEMTPEEQREVTVGKFWNKQKAGYKSFKKGITDTGKLNGMSKQRVDILDREIPQLSSKVGPSFIAPAAAATAAAATKEEEEEDV